MYYIYTISHQREVFYVGMTSNPMNRFKAHYSGSGSYCQRFLRYLNSQYQRVEFNILERDIENLDYALQRETYYINKYSVDCTLLNRLPNKRNHAFVINILDQLLLDLPITCKKIIDEEFERIKTIILNGTK
jgi:predicted GIY-YIG superfamily endonuclease